MTIRVAVTGAAGRMGTTVCRAVEEAEGLELVARLDAGDPITAENLNGADVAVDFTVPAVAERRRGRLARRQARPRALPTRAAGAAPDTRLRPPYLLEPESLAPH